MINIYPKDYSSRINTINALSEYISEIDNIDFDKMVDSSIEGAENFADEASKAVKNPSAKAVSELDSLFQELENELYEDFSDKFSSYLFLIENKIEDLDDFPFREWQQAFDSLKNKPDLDYEEILNNIDKIANINKDVAVYNLSAFLNVIQYNDLKISGLFPHLNLIINKHFNEAQLINLVSATNYSEFCDALNGKGIPIRANSHLFFEYAAYLPIENFAIKQNMSRHLNQVYKIGFSHKDNIYPNSLGLNIPLNVSDMNEIYHAFSETDIWRTIKKSDVFKNLFIKNSVKFYQASVHAHYINNSDKFVNILSKDDVIFAETFFNALDKFIHGSAKENAKIKFGNALKISLKFILDKEIPQSEIKVKKAKI